MPIRLFNIGTVKSCVAVEFMLNQHLHYENTKGVCMGVRRVFQRGGAAAAPVLFILNIS